MEQFECQSWLKYVRILKSQILFLSQSVNDKIRSIKVDLLNIIQIFQKTLVNIVNFQKNHAKYSLFRPSSWISEF